MKKKQKRKRTKKRARDRQPRAARGAIVPSYDSARASFSPRTSHSHVSARRGSASYISVSYTIRCECNRGVMKNALEREIEFIVEARAAAAAAAARGRPVRPSRRLVLPPPFSRRRSSAVAPRAPSSSSRRPSSPIAPRAGAGSVVVARVILRGGSTTAHGIVLSRADPARPERPATTRAGRRAPRRDALACGPTVVRYA